MRWARSLLRGVSKHWVKSMLRLRATVAGARDCDAEESAGSEMWRWQGPSVTLRVFGVEEQEDVEEMLLWTTEEVAVRLLMLPRWIAAWVCGS